MLAGGEEVGADDLPEEIRRTSEKTDRVLSKDMEAGPDLETLEKAYIYYTLHQTGWNKSKAARILGIDLSTLYRKIDRYSLPKNP